MKMKQRESRRESVRRGILEWLVSWWECIHFDQNFNGGTIGDEFERGRAVKAREGKQSTWKVLSYSGRR